MSLSCASEETLLEFIEGRLSPEAFEGVEQHLSQCEACRELVAVATPATSPEPAGGDKSFPSGGQPKVGRYEILAPIGAGGMGVVYAAHDPQLERKVALKMLRPSGLPGVSPQQLRARILREGRAMARLSHPNVLAVHDVGEFQDHVFVAMELAEGGTVASWLRERPRSWREVLDVFLAAGRGLAAAHAQGLVHRDFKPENILFGGDGRVRVTDFGVAQLTAVPGSELLTAGTPEAGGPTLSLTSSALVGSPAYMAPEQMRGEHADVRADIFSFCVSLYEALYGERPFAGETVADLQRAVSESEFRRPPGGTRVPAWIRRALLRGLRAEPEERPQTMEALLASLSRPRRRWAPLFLAGMGLLAAALGLVWYFVWPGRTQPAPDAQPASSIAVVPFVNMSGDKENEYFSDGITEELINALTNIDGLQVASRTSVYALKSRNLDAREIGARLNVKTLLEGSVRREGDALRVTAQLINVSDDFHIWSRTYDRKLTGVFALEDEIAHSIAQALRRKLVGGELVKPSTSSLEAHDLYLQGRYFMEKRSAESLRQAATFFAQATEKDSAYALAWVGLADATALQYQYGRALASSVLPQAKKSALRALELDTRLAEAHATLGMIATGSYQWADAEHELRKAIELNPKYPTAHQWYGLLLNCQGRILEASAEADRAYWLDPTSPVINSLVAHTRFYGGDFDGAIEGVRKVMEISPDFSSAHALLGRVYAVQGRYAEAFSEYDKASDASEAEGARGVTYVLAGRRADALRLVEEMEQRAKREYVSPAARGLIWVALGEKDRGYALLSRACDEIDWRLRAAKADPLFESLRAEPRFHEMLKCIHLE